MAPKARTGNRRERFGPSRKGEEADERSKRFRQRDEGGFPDQRFLGPEIVPGADVSVGQSPAR
jgi:hypothetical protein